MHPVGFLFPVLRFLCNLLCSSLTQQCSHPGSIKQYICFSEESATQLTQQSCLMFKYKVEYTRGISLQGSVLDTFFPKLFKQSVLQPVLWRLGVRGSVCQMAQRTWRSRGDQGGRKEERGGGGCCHFKVCALLSWSAWLCNSHIIIRGRPRPAACQPLCVGSCLLWILRQTLDGNVFWVVVVAGVYF